MKEIRTIEMNHLNDSTEICITFNDKSYHYFNLSNIEKGLFINKNDTETAWEMHKGENTETF
jgi:hypothetical protein